METDSKQTLSMAELKERHGQLAARLDELGRRL